MMPTQTKNLEYYSRFPLPQVSHLGTYLSLVQSNISGGTISRDEIDRIREFPEATEIAISGLTQDTFDYFIENYGKQLTAIAFWKCPRVRDLRMIELLDKVEYLVFYWNQRADSLWDLSKTKSLKGLAYDDFTRMHDISQIALSPSLEELEFGNYVWSKYLLDTLEPLKGCKSLKSLLFSAKKIRDNRIEPLADLQQLEHLNFPPHQFSTAQVAWLKAHLPNTVASNVLQPYVTYKWPTHANGEIDEALIVRPKDTAIVGKGKPRLDSVQDRRRIERYAEEFNRMNHWYLEHPTASPDDLANK